MKHKSSRNFNGIKQVLLSKKLQRVLAVVLVFSLMVSTPGSIWGQGMLGVGAQGEEQIPPASSSAQPNNETAPPVSSTSVPVSPSEPNSSTSVPIAPSEPASTPKTPEHKGVQPIVPPSAAVVAVGDLIAKLPDAVAPMPTDTQENYDAWANGIRSYSDTIKALDTSFAALTQDEKALLTKAQLDKKDAWINALAGLPTALAAEVTLSGSSAYKTLVDAYNAVDAGGTINVDGIIDVTNGITVTKDVTIKGTGWSHILQRGANTVTTPMITVTSGNLVLDGGIMLDGYGTTYADATAPMIKLNGGSCTVNGASLQNSCVKGNGSAIYVGTGAALTLANSSTIISNRTFSTDGKGGGAIYVNGGTLTLQDGSKIKNNTTDLVGDKGSGSSANGAGVRLDNGAVFNMTGGEITNNKGAGGQGGGVYMEEVKTGNAASTFNLSGGTITGNTASYTPSAGIAVRKGNTLNISGTPIVKDNKKGTAQANICLETDTVLKLTAALTGTANVGVTLANGSDITASANAENIKFGTAVGGATGAEKIIGDDGALVGSLNGADLKFAKKQISPLNTVYVSVKGNDSNDGSTEATAVKTLKKAASLLVKSGTPTIYVIGEVSVGENTDFADNSPTIKSCDGKTDGVLKRAAGYTGALITLNGNTTTTLNNITLDGNNINSAAALVVVNDSTGISGLVLADGAMLQNNKTSSNGGAVNIVNGKLTVQGTAKIQNNSAVKGGGIYVNVGTVNMSAGSISGNTASNQGGGIFTGNASCILNISGGSITDNHCAANTTNAGISLAAPSKLNLSGAPVITGNTPTGKTQEANVGMSGASIVIKGNLINGANIGISYGTGNNAAGTELGITENASFTGYDKIKSDNTVLTVALSGTKIVFANKQGDTYVSESGADTNAGTQAAPFKTLLAAYNALPTIGGTIHVIGTVPVNSTTVITKPITITSDDGIGVLQRASGNTGCIISSSAEQAGLTLSNITLDGMKLANVKNALLEVSGGTTTIQAGTVLQNNISTAGGYTSGGVYVYGGKLIMEDGIIRGNSAPYGGGVTLMTNGSFTMKGGSITGNASTRNGIDSGAGVHMYTTGTFELLGGSITGNTTSGQGGGVCYETGAAFKLGGSGVNVTGNTTTSGAINNISLLDSNNKINITSALTTSTLGVTAYGASTGRDIITTTLNSNVLTDAQLAQFTSDDPIYKPVLSADAKAIELVFGCLYIGGAGASATGNGSFATPYDSINAAIAAVPNGGTIYVKGNVNCSASVVHTAKAFTIESCDNTGKKITEILKPNDARMQSITRIDSSTILNFVNGDNVTLRNVKITDSSLTVGSNAPIIINDGATLNIKEGAVITKMSGQFGAVYLRSGAIVNMYDNAFITDNINKNELSKAGETSGAGAGVTVLDKATFNMYGGTISGNKADKGYGGGICVSKTNITGANAGAATVNITGTSVITENTAKYGGGIAYEAADTICKIESAVQITKNTAATNGGGVYLNNKNLNMHDQSADLIRIIDNTVSGKANNMYITKDGEISAATLSLNPTNKNYIGITTENMPTSANPITFVKTGNLYNSENIAAKVFISDNPLFAILGDVTTAPYNIKLTMPTDVYVKADGNDANTGTSASPYKTLKKAYDAVANNGVIHVIGSVPMALADNIVVSKVITIKEEGTAKTGELKRVTGNTGELITVNNGGKVTLLNIIVDGGATYKNGEVNPKNASGVITTNGYKGQLAYVNNGGALVLGNGAVLRNNAKLATGSIANDRGSAIWVEGTVEILQGSEISNNCMSGYASDGAAFSIYTSTGNVTMRGGVIKNNYADRMGSAIRVSNGQFAMNGGEITGNIGTADTYGAVCFNSGKFYIGGTAKITGNKCGGIERNVYLMGGMPKISALLADGANIGITAQNAYLGAIVTQNENGVQLTADNTKYITYDGGAFDLACDESTDTLSLTSAGKIYVGKDGADTNPGTYAKPYATLAKAYAMAKNNTNILVKNDMTDGGDFVLADDKAVTIASCDASGNITTSNPYTVKLSGTGNHFTLRGNAKLTIKNLIIDNGTTERTGRMFITNDGGTPALTLGAGAKIINGKSSFGGGSIYWNYGTLAMEKGSVISGSNSSNNAGAVYMQGGTFTMDGTVENCTAPTGKVGGIYYGGGALNMGANAKVTGNLAGTVASNVYVAGGKTINVTGAIAEKSIGITTANGAIPTSKRVAVATGSATAAMFTNDRTGTTEKFELDTGTVYLANKSSNTNIAVNWQIPSVDPTFRGAAAWDMAKGTVLIKVPYEPVAGNLIINSYPEYAKASVTDEDETNLKKVTSTIALPFTGDKTVTVTAEDGTTKAFTITVERMLQTDKNVTFNFDGSNSGASAADSVAALSFMGLPDGNGYVFKDDTNTVIKGLSANVTNGIVTLTAKAQETIPSDGTSYYKNIKNWSLKKVGNTNIQVASYEQKITMYQNDGTTKIGTFVAKTYNATTDDLKIVEGIVKELSPDPYKDAYQNAMDMPSQIPDHEQNNTEDTAKYFAVIEDEGKSSEYVLKYVEEAVAKFVADANTTAEQKKAIKDGRNQNFATTKQFIAPIAGTADKPLGVDGLYVFTVTVASGLETPLGNTTTPGGAATESSDKRILIKAHQYSGVDTNTVIQDVAGITPQPSGTVYVNYGSTQEQINTEVKNTMSATLDTAVGTVLNKGGATVSKSNVWTIVYNGGADNTANNYAARANLTVTKNKTDNIVPVEIPLTIKVVVRPNIDAGIKDALVTAIGAGSKTFDDMDAANADTEAKIISAIKAKFTNIADVTVTTSATGETAATHKYTAGTDFTYAIDVLPVGSGFVPAVNGSAADSNGINGQYIFNVQLTVTRGENVITEKLNITDSPMKVTADINTDNGIYITPTLFNGTTDIVAVDVVKALLSNNTPAVHSLSYPNRNNAAARLAAVQQWVQDTIKQGGEVSISGSTTVKYVVTDGKAQRFDNNVAVGSAVDLMKVATARLTNANISPFTSVSSASSIADVKDSYTVDIVQTTIKNRKLGRMFAMPRAIINVDTPSTVSNTTYAVEHKFSHTQGAVTQPVTGGTGPYTVVLLNKTTGLFTTLQGNADGTITIPETVALGDYEMGIRDSGNTNSVKQNLTLPVSNVVQLPISLSAGSLIIGSVTADGAAATGATVNANDVTTIAVGTNGGYLAANVSSSAMANITASKQAITGVTSTAIPAKNNVNIAMTSGTVTVIGGKVMQYVNNNEVAASGTKVVITSKDGKTYTGYVDTKGDFAVPGVPAAGGTGYSVLFDDGNTKTARFENVTITPHTPADGYATTDITFPTKIMPPNVGEIIGVVDKNGNPVNGAVVTLYYGTQKLASQTTASDGKYKFTGINYGYYRMVVTYGSIEVTKIFELNGANKTLPISLPNGNENTVVEQKEKTPPTTADIPHTLFDTVTQDTAKGITQAEKDTLTNGGTIEIKLVAELRADTDAKEDRAKITDAIDTANGKIGLLLDLSVLKTVTDSSSTVLTNAQRLTELSDVLTIILELPQEYQGKTKELSLYRVHNGATEKMKTAGKEHYSFINVGGKDYLKVVASKFSSYALVSTKDNGPIIDSSSSSSSSSGSSSSSNNDDDDIYLPPTAPSKPNKKPAKKPAPSSSSQASSSSASSKPIEKEDTSKIDAKAKEDLKADLKDMLDKAIAALPSDLTDEQRADAIAKLTAIYDKAIAKIDKATADEGKKIYDDAVEQMNAVSADSLSTNSTKKCKLCGKCTPFLGICIWVWIAILVISVVAVITLFILYKRKKDNETAQNQEKIDRK